MLNRLHSRQTQEIPGRAGFKIITSGKSSFGNSIGNLPANDLPGTSMSTINEMLNQGLAIEIELHLDELVFVIDQAIYAKVIEVKWKHMDKFHPLRLDAFHTTCVIMSIMGK